MKRIVYPKLKVCHDLLTLNLIQKKRKIPLRTFTLTLKHNAMKFKIQNTGKTPVKNKYGKFHNINTIQCALSLLISLQYNAE